MMDRPDIVQPLSLEQETTIRFGEHEILLSFVNDDGAALFDEWFANEGNYLFQKYCKDNPLP